MPEAQTLAKSARPAPLPVASRAPAGALEKWGAEGPGVALPLHPWLPAHEPPARPAPKAGVRPAEMPEKLQTGRFSLSQMAKLQGREAPPRWDRTSRPVSGGRKLSPPRSRLLPRAQACPPMENPLEKARARRPRIVLTAGAPGGRAPPRRVIGREAPLEFGHLGWWQSVRHPAIPVLPEGGKPDSRGWSGSATPGPSAPHLRWLRSLGGISSPSTQTHDFILFPHTPLRPVAIVLVGLTRALSFASTVDPDRVRAAAHGQAPRNHRAQAHRNRPTPPAGGEIPP